MRYGPLVLLMLYLLPHDRKPPEQIRHFRGLNVVQYHDRYPERTNHSQIREIATCGCLLLAILIVTVVILCVLFTISLLIAGKLTP